MAGRRTPRAGGNRSAETSGTEPAAQQARARQICLQLLTTRPRTRTELAVALAKRGIDEVTARQVLARFEDVGLIDDAAFAESYVHSGHSYRGLGRRALAAQLRRRGVDERTTGEAIAAVDHTAEEQMARTLVRRRLLASANTGDQATMVRKLVGMLARRGYQEGMSYRVVREELRAAGHGTELLDNADVD